MADETAIEIEGSEVPDAIVRSNGLPRLNWEQVDRWVQVSVPEDRARDAWTSAQMQWLGRLSFALGPHYHLFQSPRALLLGAMNRAFGRYASGRIERALTTLDYVLPGIVQESSRGKHVVICLAGEDEVKRYMAEYPETSDNWDGICLRREDVHVVIRCAEAIPDLLLVHELTHACLTHLQLPRWLDEAMSQRMERIEGRMKYAPLTDEHRRLWRAPISPGFWTAVRSGEIGRLSLPAMDWRRTCCSRYACPKPRSWRSSSGMPASTTAATPRPSSISDTILRSTLSDC